MFDLTHALVVSAIDVLAGWATSAGNREEVEAETGAWLVGDEETKDLKKGQKRQAGFVKFYGAEGRPAGLRKDALAKQVKAHQKARWSCRPRRPGRDGPPRRRDIAT